MGKNDFCCAPGCSNSRKTRGDLKFYRIPKDINRRRVWLKRIRRKNVSPSVNTRLCSEHFIGGQKSDEIDSVSYNPSVFKHSHDKPKLSRPTKNSLRTKRQSNATTPSRKRKVRICDLTSVKLSSTFWALFCLFVCLLFLAGWNCKRASKTRRLYSRKT